MDIKLETGELPVKFVTQEWYDHYQGYFDYIECRKKMGLTFWYAKHKTFELYFVIVPKFDKKI